MPDEERKQTSHLALFIPEDKRAEQHCGKNAKKITGKGNSCDSDFLGSISCL